MNERVAFIVQETSEMTGTVIFARSPIEARKAGASEFNGGDLGGMSVRRAKWADRFEAGGVPARELIDRGWHWDGCTGCGKYLDEDSLQEAGLPLSGVIGTVNSAVYCSSRCKWQAMKLKSRLAAEAERAVAAFKAIVAKRFPGVDFCDDETPFRTHHAYVTQGPRGGYHWQQVIVAFRFPGMHIGPATYRLDSERGREAGPVKPHYSCCNGDREVFEAWAATVKPEAE